MKLSAQRLAIALIFIAASTTLTACGFAQASHALPANVQPTTIDVGITTDGDRFLLVGTLEHGTFISFNDGEEWTQSEGLPVEPERPSFEPAVLDIEISPDGSTAFAATTTGLYKSTDSGRSWTRIDGDPVGSSEFVAAWEVSISPRYEETGQVAAIVKGRTFGDSVYFSSDKGATWDFILTSNPEDIQVLADSRIGVASYRNLAVHPMLPSAPGLVIHESNSLARATFSPNFAQDHLVFVGGSYFGDPFCPLDTVTGSCDPSSGHKLRAYTWRGNLGMQFASTQFGANPRFTQAGTGAAIQVSHSTRMPAPLPLDIRPSWGPGPHSHAEVVLSPAFATDGTGMAITWDGLARTTDSGLSWPILDLPTPEDEPLQSIAFSPDFADSGLVYAVTQRRLLKSTDGGTTWQAFPSLDELPPIPTNTPAPTPTPRLTPLPTATAAPTTSP